MLDDELPLDRLGLREAVWTPDRVGGCLRPHSTRISHCYIVIVSRADAASVQPDPAVLIVGAGPTGLLLACQLALRKVPFRIIDKSADHTTQSRALVVQARSLEIFEQMGIAQE